MTDADRLSNILATALLAVIIGVIALGPIAAYCGGK